MKTGEKRELGLPAAWNEVLDSIHQALAEAVAEAARQEQALETIFVPQQSTTERDQVANRSLEQLVERLRGLRTSFEQAEAEAARATIDLAVGAEGFKQWLAMAEATQRKLANLGTP